MVVNVSEAKAQLSSLLDRVYHGETVTIAKNNLPIAQRFSVNESGIDATQVISERANEILPCKVLCHKELQD